jgi:hypothetical protein
MTEEEVAELGSVVRELREARDAYDALDATAAKVRQERDDARAAWATLREEHRRGIKERDDARKAFRALVESVATARVNAYRAGWSDRNIAGRQCSCPTDEHIRAALDLTPEMRLPGDA